MEGRQHHRKTIDTYLLDRSETAALATVQYELAMLKRAFNLAMKRGELATSRNRCPYTSSIPRVASS